MKYLKKLAKVLRYIVVVYLLYLFAWFLIGLAIQV